MSIDRDVRTAVGGDGVFVDLIVQLEEGEKWKAQLVGLLWWLPREPHLSISCVSACPQKRPHQTHRELYHLLILIYSSKHA